MRARASRAPDVSIAERLVQEIRRELNPVEQEIRGHPYLAALEWGHVRRQDLTSMSTCCLRSIARTNGVCPGPGRGGAIGGSVARWGAT